MPLAVTKWGEGKNGAGGTFVNKSSPKPLQKTFTEESQGVIIFGYFSIKVL